MSVRKNYTIGNKIVRATIRQPLEELRSLLPTRHFIHFDHAYKISTGDFLSVNGKVEFLLIYHHVNSKSQVFTGLKVTDEVTLQRFYSGTNPTTNMSSGRFSETPKDIWVMKESLPPYDEKGLASQSNRYYCGVEVKVSDRLDDSDVVSVKKISGIYVAETNG